MAQYHVGLLGNTSTTTQYDNDYNNNSNNHAMLANSPFLFFQDEQTTSPTDDSSSPYRLNSIDFSNTSQSVDDIFGIHSSSDDNAYMVSEIRMNDPLSQQNLFNGQDNDSTLNHTFSHSNFLPEHNNSKPIHQAEQRLSSNPRMLEVNVYHKPRGCKGIWQPVEKGSALRVTKGKGKWLKLEIKSPVPILSKETEVTLLEDNVKDAKTKLDTHRVVNDSLTIETISEYQKSGFWFVDAELKLDTVSKRLQFLASASTPSGTITGGSVSFSGHNNGKASLSKAKDSATDTTSPSSDDAFLQVSRQNSITDMPQTTSSVFSEDYRHKRTQPDSRTLPTYQIPPANQPDPQQQYVWPKRLKSETYSQPVQQQQTTTAPIPYEIPAESFHATIYPPSPSPPESPLLHQFMVPPQESFSMRQINNNQSPPSVMAIPQSTTRIDVPFGQGPTTVLNGPLEVHGSVRAMSFIQFSDLRLKTDVQDLLGAVDIISQLEGKSYIWRPDDTDNLTGGKRVIGLIAQQVQKVLPEVVTEDPLTGYLSVSYTEIIPILIEAFKVHTKNYQADKEDTTMRLNMLTSKLEELSRKSPPSKFDFRIETGDTDDLQSTPFGSRLLMNRPILKQGIKFGSFVGFAAGLIMIIFGAITLGILLALPAQQTLIAVEQATNLQSLGSNSSVNPDPFCEVTAGTAFFRTQTVWDTKDPVWQQVFVATDQRHFIPQVFFMVKDDSKNYSQMPPRTMGYATFVLGSDFPINEPVSRELPLSASSNGQIVRGQLRVTVLVDLRKKPDWEVALIVLGVFITAVSALSGSLVWMSIPFPFLKKLYRGYVITEDSPT